MTIYGFFAAADQTVPSFDPGLAVSCPVCLQTLRRPVKTISLMKEGDERSFFFRAHSECWQSASEDEREQIETALIDRIGETELAQ